MLGEHLPTWLRLVIQFINFGILVFVIVKFSAKPFKDFLKKRHDSVKEKIDAAEKTLKEAASAKAAYEAKLAGLEAEIESFRKAAIISAEEEKARILEEAQRLATHIREQAQLAYDQEMRSAMEKIRAHVAERTIKTATQQVRETFSLEDHNLMVEEFIQKVRSTN
jgi:F-type H+-transporting ATPase subunit b